MIYFEEWLKWLGKIIKTKLVKTSKDI
jgi:hypothetical protein